ncbi:uncharacterized protein Z519_10760 [Cladophialophora bantiana CBS 173.52]|uniref:Protein YAE1 n=1 Tax=Cladophialophora bantiana (strain ATCC 10958 / CBS 173.52 / CDC B-1940 / NIH 8579) TaxID=1442370 RepID=A0A0D2HVU9_CLAB1|nr:uncharacterized protein Z519_10760 [Cladophialophora bantiana CBS 173.52]KIW88714.1 hypothetical protein Z519_10760 [Cladophialophora bantiana CBS 173.52]
MANSSGSTPSPTHSWHSSPESRATTPEGAQRDVEFFGDDALPVHGHGAAHGAQRNDEPQAQLSGDLREEILSDIPSLRRQHMTDGYREGLSVAKARVMQRGFDAGYPLGVELGLRVGKVLGVLEGIIHGSKGSKPRSTGNPPEAGPSSSTNEATLDGVNDGAMAATPTKRVADIAFMTLMYSRAQKELSVSELLKSVTDETVAAIPEDASAGAVDDGSGQHEAAGGNKKAEVDAVLLPAEIEAALEKWERMVLGAF